MNTHIASTSAQTSTSAKPFDTGIPHQAPAAFAGGLLGLGLWLMASPSVHGLVAESSHLRCCTSGRPSGLTLRHELPHRVSSSSSPPHGRTRRGRRVRPPVATIIDRRFASVPRSVRTCRRCGRSTRGYDASGRGRCRAMAELIRAKARRVRPAGDCCWGAPLVATVARPVGSVAHFAHGVQDRAAGHRGQHHRFRRPGRRRRGVGRRAPSQGGGDREWAHVAHEHRVNGWGVPPRRQRGGARGRGHRRRGAAHGGRGARRLAPHR